MYVSHQQQRIVQQQRLREVSERNQTRPEGSRKHPHKEEQGTCLVDSLHLP